MQIGDVLQNRYEITGRLGQGGFGTVYKATDRRLKRDVAVKELRNVAPDDRAYLWSIDREVEILAGLEHSALTDVGDYFNEGNNYYIVMDYVPGQDLSQVLEQRGALGQAQALEMIDPVLDALEYLHSRIPPIIHRDIKPANIRVSDDGRVYLVDFGLAKQYDPDTIDPRTRVSVSHNYAPIEQYQKGGTDPRSDLYALGATLYTMLSGQIPPGAPERVVKDTLQPLNTLNSAISPRLSDIVLRLLQLQPDQRYQSVAELRQDLAQVSGPYAAVPATTPLSTPPVVPAQPSSSWKTPVTPPPPPSVATQPQPQKPRRRIGCCVGAIIPVALLAVLALLIGPATLRTWLSELPFQNVTATSTPASQSLDPTLAPEPTAIVPLPPTSLPEPTATPEPLPPTATTEPTPTEIACQVPDLIGLDQFDAEIALEDAELLSGIAFATDDSNVPFGTVIDQDPPPGNPCFPGDVVQMVVKARPTATPTP